MGVDCYVMNGIECLADVRMQARTVAAKRSVSAWTFDLTPGSEKEIKVAYRLKWPGDREVVFEPRVT